MKQQKQIIVSLIKEKYATTECLNLEPGINSMEITVHVRVIVESVVEN